MSQEVDSASPSNELDLDIREVLALGGIDPDGNVCAFLGGSLAEGLGNRSSDIDIYVLGKPNLSFTPSHIAQGTPTQCSFYGNRRLAFEYWDMDRVGALVDKLNALSLGRSETANVLLEDRLSAGDIALMHRLRTGVAWAGSKEFEAVRARFDFAKLARYLMQVSSIEIDRFHEDLCGAMADGDVTAALPFARDLLDHVADAYLHFQGSTNPKRKWRLKLLEKLTAVGAKVREQYWELSFPDARSLLSDRGRFLSYCEACLRFANAVTDHLLGYEATFPSGNELRGQGVLIRANPAVRRKHLDGQVVLCFDNRFFTIEPWLDALWSVIQQPCDLDMMVANLIKTQSLSADAAASYAEGAWSMLLEQGLAVPYAAADRDADKRYTL